MGEKAFQANVIMWKICAHKASCELHTRYVISDAMHAHGSRDIQWKLHWAKCYYNEGELGALLKERKRRKNREFCDASPRNETARHSLVYLHNNDMPSFPIDIGTKVKWLEE